MVISYYWDPGDAYLYSSGKRLGERLFCCIWSSCKMCIPPFQLRYATSRLRIRVDSEPTGNRFSKHPQTWTGMTVSGPMIASSSDIKIHIPMMYLPFSLRKFTPAVRASRKITWHTGAPIAGTPRKISTDLATWGARGFIGRLSAVTDWVILSLQSWRRWMFCVSPRLSEGSHEGGRFLP